MIVDLTGRIAERPYLPEHLIGQLGFLIKAWKRASIYLIGPKEIEDLVPPGEDLWLDERCVWQNVWDGDRNAPSLGMPPRPLAQRRDQSGDTTDLCEGTSSDHRRCEAGPPRLAAPRPEALWGRLSRCRQPRRHDLLGIYLRNLTPHQRRILAGPGAVHLPEGPSIFLCPDNIHDSARKIQRDGFGSGTDLVKILFDYVLLHELAHAYIDRDCLGHHNAWTRLVEESLCTAIGIGHFIDVQDRSALHIFLDRCPLEYKCYTYWLDLSTSVLKGFAEALEMNDEDLSRAALPPRVVEGRPWLGPGRGPQEFWKGLGAGILHHYFR